METLIPIEPLRFGSVSFLIIALLVSLACWRPVWIVTYSRWVLAAVLLISLAGHGEAFARVGCVDER